MSTQATALDTLFDHAPPRPTSTPDTWLIDRLIRTGHLTETGLSRRARPRPCTRCGAWTIAGIDADVLAFESHCDPHPLTPLGEVVALASGRRTLSLVRTRGRLELEQRWADHIDGTRHRLDVLATHVCRQRIPTEWTCTSIHAPPASAAIPPNSPPPF